jgi:hypothetical protein
MAEPLATQADVAAVLVRPLTTEETSYVDGLIANVSALARRKVPNLDTYLSDGTVDPTLAAFAVSMCVARILLNPERASQHSVSVGPFVESITHSQDTRNEQGTFTDEELSWLRPPGTTVLGTVMTSPGLEARGAAADHRWQLEWDAFQAVRR